MVVDRNTVLRLGLSKSGVVAAALIGAMVGLGAYTFYFANGFSYIGSDPKTCVNCHIMNQQYASWNAASHHSAATCVDCHLPASGIDKYVAKGENGFHHSWAFTFQDFHEPIMIHEKNSRILQENCLRCHGQFVHQVVSGSTTDKNAVQCVHCHQSVGHGPRK